MDVEQVLQAKRETIRQHLPRRGNIKVTMSSLRKSILEAIVSRADRFFSRVIYRAFLEGARFDGYKEHFSWEKWERAMKEENIDYHFYLESDTENFPWSFIET